ncbi:MAG: type II toxin-antitoxin system prevent-host-death family antitoxin, partial [Solirubrobacteraceae bacterium]|nr:type II toxin-antitoxin system prevent-host-death family antitoxin [Solirubrobacteraceae bacterium]
HSDTLPGMRRVGMHEAKTQLSRLVELAEAGEEIVIQRSGRPVARLVAIEVRRPVSEAFGTLKGQIELKDDFDDLPDEFAHHFRQAL